MYKIHFRNDSFKKYSHKRYIFKSTFSKNFNLIATLCQNHNQKKITQIIIDMPNFLFSNCIYTLLKTLADNNSYLF